MAFLSRLFSIFHKKSRKNHSGPSASPDSSSSNDSKHKSHLENSSDLSAESPPPPPYTICGSNSPIPHPICPHDTLTLSRLKTISNLPNFRLNGARIDALTPASACHFRGHDKRTKDAQDSCKPLGTGPLDNTTGIVRHLKGFGTYTWKNTTGVNGGAGGKGYSKWTTSGGGGIYLSFHWEFYLLSPTAPKFNCPDVETLRKFVKDLKIPICPHKELDDEYILQACFAIVNPSAKPPDPIERYLMKENGLGCEVKGCGTKVKVSKRKEPGEGKVLRVDIGRWLGKGEERD